MGKTLKGIILLAVLLTVSLSARAEDVAKEQLKGLDEQVQDIKSDVLSIATELNQLEEKLLYPSNTEFTVFVSLVGNKEFRLDAVDLELDGKPVAHHIYSFKELEALRKGGVQRVHTGNIRTGEHDLQATLSGKSAGGSDYTRTASFKVSKDVGPRIIELTLAGPGSDQEPITLKDW